MFVIRPIHHDDLDGLFDLVQDVTFGLTSLPKDRQLLTERIADSQHGLANISHKLRGESFLFVMEDLDEHRVVGTSGIVSKVGGFEPFYAYRIEKSVHHSDMLNVHKEVPTLHLVEQHNGPAEIGSLFLAPRYRGSGLSRLLSLSRFLYIADHLDHIDPTVIAELRGVVDEQGRAPVWEALGRHFFDIEYSHADYLSAVDKTFIADLMPKHPIYVPLLPAAAQAVIGQEHEKTRPARKMLESEGFSFSGMVDIFEAGPVLSCPARDIRSVRDSRSAPVATISTQQVQSPVYLISNVQRDFRAVRGTLDVAPDRGVTLSDDAAAALCVDAGDTVRYVLERAPAGVTGQS